MLPDSNNFIDCYQHLRDNIEADASGSSYHWRDKADLGFVLVVEDILWQLDRANTSKIPIMMEACGANEIYRNDFFRLLECRDEDIRRLVPLTQDSPFLQINR